MFCLCKGLIDRYNTSLNKSHNHHLSSSSLIIRCILISSKLFCNLFFEFLCFHLRLMIICNILPANSMYFHCVVGIVHQTSQCWAIPKAFKAHLLWIHKVGWEWDSDDPVVECSHPLYIGHHTESTDKPWWNTLHGVKEDEKNKYIPSWSNSWLNLLIVSIELNNLLLSEPH